MVSIFGFVMLLELIIGTPDLGQGGVHAGGVALQQEEVHLHHTCVRPPLP
jgi:hypothetical protein